MSFAMPHPAFIPKRMPSERPRLYLPIEETEPRGLPEEPKPDNENGFVIIPLIEETEEDPSLLRFRV